MSDSRLENHDRRYTFPPYTSTYRALVQPETSISGDEADRRNREILGIGFRGLIARIRNYFI